MEEGEGGAAVRVVRCPKCDQLLPELPDFTLYRCGGCGTTLRAKRVITHSGASMGVSDGESSSEIKGVGLDGSLKADRDRDSIEFRRGVKIAVNRGANLGSNLVPKSEDLFGIGGGHVRYCRSSKAPLRELKFDADEFTKKNIQDYQETKGFGGNTTDGYHEVRQKQRLRRYAERDRESEFCRGLRALMQGNHLAPYAVVGPSSYHPSPTYGFSAGINTHKLNPGAYSGVDENKQRGAEILRKLDEFRDQLRRSCNVNYNPKGKTVVNRAMSSSGPYGNDRGHGTLCSEGSPSLNRTPDRHSHFMKKHGIDRQSFYHGLHPHDISGNYEVLRPTTSCSCMRCYIIHCQPPTHVPPTFLCRRRVSSGINNNGFTFLEGPSMLQPSNYNLMVANASLHSHEPRIQQRAMFSKNDRRSCRPIDGASPFIVCHNCFKLLQIPESILLLKRNQWKLRCGECSQVILLEVNGRRRRNSSSNLVSLMLESSENNNNPRKEIEEAFQCHDHDKRNPVTSCSGNDDCFKLDDQSAVEKRVLISPSVIFSPEMIKKDCNLTLSKSERMRAPSVSSCTSENAEIPDGTICREDLPNSTESPVETEVTPQFSSLLVQEQFGYPSSDHGINVCGKGSMSISSDQGITIPLDVKFNQKLVEDAPVATEMDISVDDCSHPGLSQDSWEGSKGEDEPWISKGDESFFAVFAKKSNEDLPQFNQPVDSGRSKVFVNGHPVSDCIVKNAEKLAGPIHPGEYWYDYRAGFWGVMGNQCLGIIPSFIDYFNYPMSKNCAGGNTGVLVNGRELHQEDLDLLVGRGLPATEGQSYIIEISGEVWDEASGEKLGSLGKLAPTVERMKHGCGMRVPSFGAPSCGEDYGTKLCREVSDLADGRD